MSQEYKKPLKPGYLDAYIELEDKVHTAAWVIGNHLGEVVNVICDEFGVDHPATIYFEGAEEGDIGRPCLYTGNAIQYEFDCLNFDGKIPNLKAGEWDFSHEVPKEYMYMTLKNVMLDVRKHINADKNKKKISKAKRTLAKKKKSNLAAAAKKKLTKAELKALGIKS